MRPIDADALPRHGKRGGLVQWKDIAEAPTIDAVEVVRCKECKYKYMYKSVWECPYGLMITADGYCNYGERKGE